MTDPLATQLRRTSWHIQAVQMQLAARRLLDQSRLGTGSAERLCTALILGAAFFFAALILSHIAGLPRGYPIAIAVIAIASSMTASGILVLWKSDGKLEDQLPRLRTRLAELKEAAAAELSSPLPSENELPAIEPAKPTKALGNEGSAIEPVWSSLPTKICPYCHEPIQIRALKCKHCGEYLDPRLRPDYRPQSQPEAVAASAVVVNIHHPRPPRWNPGVAAVLSLLWPGLGQIYKGQVLNGFAWWFIVALGYLCCLVPGFFLHVFCVFGAASGGE